MAHSRTARFNPCTWKRMGRLAAQNGGSDRAQGGAKWQPGHRTVCTAPQLRITADKGGNLKREIARLRTVFDGAKYVGCTTETARGIAAYAQHSNRIGMFATADAAVRGLRTITAAST
jgi:hypothetical protein